MIKTILLGLLVLAGAFATYIAAQPSAFTVRREGIIAAPPAAVFAQVNNFHNWQEWSPWAKLDPAAASSYDGPASGVGSGFAWAGNSEVGEGKMTITESAPDERIRMRLEFTKPWPATNDTLFTFKPEGQGTRMTWEMSGHNNFLARVVCFFMNMDKMVGANFEQGFANLNALLKAKA